MGSCCQSIHLWGAVTLIECLWMWPWIVAEFMGSFCSLTMQKEAAWEGHRNAAFPYLFPFHQPVVTHWFCSHRTESENKLCHHTLVPWQYSLCLIEWCEIIQEGLNGC